MTTKISIVTPNLNCGAYLKQTLESVASQNYGNVEHIVLDGGSSDNSVDVLKAWTVEMGGACQSEVEGMAVAENGNYSFRWISSKDKGQTDAINKGFRMATGDIRTWLNADEFYYPGTLDAVAKVFEADPEISLLYGEAMFTRIDGSPIRARHVHRPDKNVFLYYGCYMASVATFYNGSLFDDGIFLDDDYKVTMDFEFYARLWSLGKKIEFLPRVLGAFRLTGDNVSVRLVERKKAERLKVQQKYGAKVFGGRPMPAYVLKLLSKYYQIKSGLMRFGRQLGRISEGELQ